MAASPIDGTNKYWHDGLPVVRLAKTLDDTTEVKHRTVLAVELALVAEAGRGWQMPGGWRTGTDEPLKQGTLLLRRAFLLRAHVSGCFPLKHLPQSGHSAFLFRACDRHPKQGASVNVIITNCQIAVKVSVFTTSG